ncbi:hypothetical protein FXO38_02963 [Capsicum annuum]|nr:hypothetical protein FXO38_02963 [Capsicum annuum]
MADTQRCRVFVVAVLFILYVLIFFIRLRMAIRNGRTIDTDEMVIRKGRTIDTDETQFDLLFLQSLPMEKTQYEAPADEPMKSLNQSRYHLVSLASANPPSVSPPPLSTTADDTTYPPPPPPSSLPLSTTAMSPPPPPPLSLSQRQIQEQQLTAILEALIGAGDFVGWANLLSSADLSSLPVAATFFIPGNDAMSNHLGVQNLDPLLIPYHIIPQRLTFTDLLQFKPNTHIPTLLPSKFLIVTSNSISNFTIDGSLITYPDLYVNPAFTVHGVDKILEYTVYGTDPPINNTVPDVAAPSPPSKPKSVLPAVFPAGGVRGFVDSADPNTPLAIEKLMIFSVLLGVSSSIFWL